MTRAHLTSLAWPSFGAIASAMLPLVLAGAVPWRDVATVGGAADPLQQTAILHYTLHHLPLTPADWNAPWLWPAPHALATMDPLVTQALLVAWLPGARTQAALAYGCGLALTLALSFVGMRQLARRTGLGRGAAWLAGAAYTMGPYSAGHFMHLNQLPQPWLPLAALGLLDLAGGGRTAVAGRRGAHSAGGRNASLWSGSLLVAAALLAQLGSGVYLMAATGVAVGILTLALAPSLRARAWLALVAALAVAAVVTWWYGRPYAAAAADLPGFVRSPEQVGPFAARPFDLLHPPASHLLPWPPALDARPSLYPGWLWAMLAVAGGAALWRAWPRGAVERRWLVGLLAAAAVCTVLTFGRSMPLPGLGEVHMPFAWLQDAVWPLRAIRAPSRFFVVTSLALALCGAAGVEWLLQRARSRTARAIATAGVLLALLELAPGPIARLRVQPNAEERHLLAALAAQPQPSPWAAFPQPCDESAEGVLDARTMLWAVWTQQPVAGGASGFVPEEVAALREACCAGPGDECLAYLERSGIRLALLPRGAASAAVALERLVVTDTWELIALPWKE